MALFAIGDTHLSLGCDKPMDVFSGWSQYVEKLEENWRAQVSDGDTVVLAGDISWGMTLEQSLEDFRFLDRLPGQKWIVKGNHDYWWATRKKMEQFFLENGLSTLHILHNNFVQWGGYALCGTRGWLFENGVPQDEKVLAREAGRLAAAAAPAAAQGLEPLAFLHYPPVYGEEESRPILDVLARCGVRRCYYGHIHGQAAKYAVNGVYQGIQFQLISCDYLNFNPFPIELS